MSENADVVRLLQVDYKRYEANGNVLRSLNNFVVQIARYGCTQLKANLLEPLLP